MWSSYINHFQLKADRSHFKQEKRSLITKWYSHRNLSTGYWSIPSNIFLNTILWVRAIDTYPHIESVTLKDWVISVSTLMNMKWLHIVINFKWPIRIRIEYLNMWLVIRLWDKCGENSAQSIRKLNFSLSFNHNQLDPSQLPHSFFDVRVLIR